MGFAFRAPARTPSSAKGTVFAVGRRVFVVCPDDITRVTLTDDAGGKPIATLKTGTEVEIIAWRPLGSQGTRYQVRAPRTGVEGWLGVANVCGTKSRATATASARKPS